MVTSVTLWLIAVQPRHRWTMSSALAAKNKILRARARKVALRKCRTRRNTFLFQILSAAASVAVYCFPFINKIPQHTSILTGYKWLQELLVGHPDRFYNMFGMNRHVFCKLVQELCQHAGLEHSKHVRMEEQVAIFLRMARSGGGTREAAERFQRSGDTISK